MPVIFFPYSLARRWNFQDIAIPADLPTLLTPLNPERGRVIVEEADRLCLILELWGAEVMFDPVRRAEQISKVICRDDSRKYSRFRPARFYGGIATADCVGCNLQCIFCWSYDSVIKPNTFGEFYSPEDVARRLVGIARKKGYRQLRISGGDLPAMHPAHGIDAAYPHRCRSVGC